MPEIFVINGFYMSMREKFTDPKATLQYYTVQWPAKSQAWEDFRGKALGATDPVTAEDGALRKYVLENWKDLGLLSEPNVGDNGVHGSASPFEAMCERMNWLKASLTDDSFGKALLAAGIPQATIEAWTKDPQVEFEGKKVSLFDTLEDLDSEACIKKACEVAGVEAKDVSYPLNEAFLFVKPHAVTDATKAFVDKALVEKGFEILKEGTMSGKEIEDNLYIDNHYYAIANKASLTKPADLNPPAPKQEDFKEKFGLAWTEALAQGKVYNAVDGCKEAGLDGDAMDTNWAKAKKAGKLVKFGGGFYCGLVEY